MRDSKSNEVAQALDPADAAELRRKLVELRPNYTHRLHEVSRLEWADGSCQTTYRLRRESFRPLEVQALVAATRRNPRGWKRAPTKRWPKTSSVRQGVVGECKGAITSDEVRAVLSEVLAEFWLVAPQLQKKRWSAQLAEVSDFGRSARNLVVHLRKATQPGWFHSLDAEQEFLRNCEGLARAKQQEEREIRRRLATQRPDDASHLERFIRGHLAPAFTAIFGIDAARTVRGPFWRFGEAFFRLVGLRIRGATIVAALKVRPNRYKRK